MRENPPVDPDSEFARLLAGRRAQLVTDGDVTAVPPGAERVRTIPALAIENARAPEPEAEQVGEPVPAAIAVVALMATLCTCALGASRVVGAPIDLLAITAPLWGSTLLLAGWALWHAIRAAAADARDFVRRRGR